MTGEEVKCNLYAIYTKIATRNHKSKLIVHNTVTEPFTHNKNLIINK